MAYDKIETLATNPLFIDEAIKKGKPILMMLKSKAWSTDAKNDCFEYSVTVRFTREQAIEARLLEVVK